MTKHTPGPWTLDKSEMPMQIKADGGDHLVAECGGWIPYNSENDEANAQLIASAPDLLAACEAVIKQTGGCDSHGQDCKRLVKAAITKAKAQD